jgi:hypothetical protein
VLVDPLAHREGSGPEGAAEIVAVASWLGVLGGEDADVGYDHPVTGDRALYHVGKDCDYAFIEFKIDHFLQGGSKDIVGFSGHLLLILFKLGRWAKKKVED